MNISKIHSENFKRFKGAFDMPLNSGLNILVGDNATGKSTIIEAIHLALTGLYHGRYLKTDLSQYVFNHEVVAEYIQGINGGNITQPLPLYGHVHNGDGKPGYMEQFRQLGKRAVNVGVDVQGFHPVSIEEIIKLADG